MLRTFVVGTALLFSTSALACKMQDQAAYQAKAEQVAAVEADHLTVSVEGMSCGDCSEKVASMLEKMDGVKAAAVDYVNGEATIAFDGSVV